MSVYGLCMCVRARDKHVVWVTRGPLLQGDGEKTFLSQEHAAVEAAHTSDAEKGPSTPEREVSGPKTGNFIQFQIAVAAERRGLTVLTLYPSFRRVETWV